MKIEKNESGFSIIEMLIALAILAVGMLAVARMQLATVKNTTIGNLTTEATMLAQAKMEEIKNTADITTIADGDYVEADIDADGNAGSGIYTRTTTITTPAAPLDTSLRVVRVEVAWSSVHGGERTVTLDSITHGQGI